MVGTLSYLLLALADARSPMQALPDAAGKFKPNWESLKQYECPEWFRDAKFGIWAHWTAQCVPEQGDWYARGMYQQGNGYYNYQVDHYGHPSVMGFKDIDNAWKVDKWDPERLMKMYKAAGAKYFVSLAVHHDNFDCFDSTYQPWNSVRLGPKKDIVGTWAKLARKYGLRFGVTNHSSQAWHWLNVAYGHDFEGAKAGVPYDGALSAADGKGTWWEGLDPKDLYTGNHFTIPDNVKTAAQFRAWSDKVNGENWSKAPANDPAYVIKWQNRIKDCLAKYNPDLLYFDDSGAPMGQAGLEIFAHYYNQNIARHGGKLEAVLNTKAMPKNLLKTLVHDFERGQSAKIEEYPWQTDTCIGDWHYKRSTFENHHYKSARTVVRMLADIASKNGNLLLNVPLRGDGTIDADEEKFLVDMAAWMKVNSECIFGTRPWSVSGEGPARPKGGMFSEGGEDRYTGADFRFTRKGDTIYAIAMDWPGTKATIKSMADGSPLVSGAVRSVELLGSKDKLTWRRTAAGLEIDLPSTRPCDHAYALKIVGFKSNPAPAALAIAPVRIVANADGTIVATADRSEIHGERMQLEEKIPGTSNVGYWDDPNEWLGWSKVGIGKVGRYDVSLRIATVAASRLAVEIGGRRVEVDLPVTGDWSQFRDVGVGTFNLRAGDLSVAVRPVSSKWKSCNLASVTLRPKP